MIDKLVSEMMNREGVCTVRTLTDTLGCSKTSVRRALAKQTSVRKHGMFYITESLYIKEIKSGNI